MGSLDASVVIWLACPNRDLAEFFPGWRATSWTLGCWLVFHTCRWDDKPDINGQSHCLRNWRFGAAQSRLVLRVERDFVAPHMVAWT